MRGGAALRSGGLVLLPFLLVVLAAWLGSLFLARQQSAQAQAKVRPGFQVFRPPHEVHSLLEWDGLIWAGGVEGVVALDPGSGAIVKKIACSPEPTFVTALAVTPDGALWIGYSTGLARYDAGGCRTLTPADGLPDVRVNALYLDRQQRLWVGTWQGAAVLENGAWRTLTVADGLVNDRINVIYQDSRGGMWFGSYVAPQGGVSVCRAGRCQQFSTQNGLPHNSINAIVEDRSGSVWLGTGFYDRGGAARLRWDGSAWQLAQTLTQQEGLAGEKVRSLYEDRDGTLWAGSEYSGVAFQRSGHWQVLTVADGLANDEVKTILQDRQGNLWLGGLDGITRIAAGSLQ